MSAPKRKYVPAVKRGSEFERFLLGSVIIAACLGAIPLGGFLAYSIANGNVAGSFRWWGALYAVLFFGSIILAAVLDSKRYNYKLVNSYGREIPFRAAIQLTVTSMSLITAALAGYCGWATWQQNGSLVSLGIACLVALVLLMIGIAQYRNRWQDRKARRNGLITYSPYG